MTKIKFWKWISVPIISITPVPLIIACATDPIESYLDKMALLLNQPEQLVKIQIRSQYWLNNDPTQIDLSFNDLINNYQNVFEIIPLDPWIEWNQTINNDPNLSNQAKRLLQLSQKTITLLTIPSTFNQTVPKQLGFKINLANGRFSTLVKTLNFDLSQINLIRQNTINNQIENEKIQQFATAIAQTMIDKKNLTLSQVQADPTLLHFHISNDDFANFNDPLLKQLEQSNLNFYYDQTKPIDSNPFQLYFYYRDQLITEQPIVNQIKTKHYYLTTNNLTFKNV